MSNAQTVLDKIKKELCNGGNSWNERGDNFNFCLGRRVMKDGSICGYIFKCSKGEETLANTFKILENGHFIRGPKSWREIAETVPKKSGKPSKVEKVALTKPSLVSFVKPSKKVEKAPSVEDLVVSPAPRKTYGEFRIDAKVKKNGSDKIGVIRKIFGGEDAKGEKVGVPVVGISWNPSIDPQEFEILDFCFEDGLTQVK